MCTNFSLKFYLLPWIDTVTRFAKLYFNNNLISSASFYDLISYQLYCNHLNNRSAGPSLPAPRFASAAVSLFNLGQVCVLGGIYDKLLSNAATNTVLCLDSLDGPWEESAVLSPLPENMAWFLAATYEI